MRKGCRLQTHIIGGENDGARRERGDLVAMDTRRLEGAGFTGKEAVCLAGVG